MEGIHTVHTMTPNQLYTTRMLVLCQSDRVTLDFYESIDENYGVDEEALGQPDDKGISIPRSTICLSEQQNAQLHQQNNPIADDRNFCIDIYQQVVTFLENIALL